MSTMNHNPNVSDQATTSTADIPSGEQPSSGCLHPICSADFTGLDGASALKLLGLDDSEMQEVLTVSNGLRERGWFRPYPKLSVLLSGRTTCPVQKDHMDAAAQCPMLFEKMQQLWLEAGRPVIEWPPLSDPRESISNSECVEEDRSCGEVSSGKSRTSRISLRRGGSHE